MFFVPTPRNAIGKKMSESMASPASDETMALKPKPFSPWIRFISVINLELRSEPTINAAIEATVILKSALKM